MLYSFLHGNTNSGDSFFVNVKHSKRKTIKRYLITCFRQRTMQFQYQSTKRLTFTFHVVKHR